MPLYWTPPPGTSAAPPAPSRLARALAFSTAVHLSAVPLAAWLSVDLLPPRVDQGLVIRTIDFVEPPAALPRRGGRSDDSSGARGAARAPAPHAARPPAAIRGPRSQPDTSAPAPAAVAPPSSVEPSPPMPESAAGDVPAPPPSLEDARLAAASPRSIGAARRGPASVVGPSAEARVQPSAAPTAVAGLASGTAGSSGPVATVSVPAELVRGGTGGGSGTGPATRDGRGGGGEGGVGGGSGDVDTGDPDFSEYFRVIERRVRAAWRFPEGLAGTTQTVKIGFAVGPDGSLRDVRVVSSSSDGLNDSALTAMARAAPFPPLPQKFRALAGQPLVMSFTVTIR